MKIMPFVHWNFHDLYVSLSFASSSISHVIIRLSKHAATV